MKWSVLWLALVSLVGCTGKADVVDTADLSDPADSTDTGGAPPPTDAGVTLDAVSWSIEQDPTGLTMLDGGGWRLQRDDGLELELYQGYLVVHTLVLESCDEYSARTPPPHGLPDHDSRTLQPVALALHELTSATLGSATFEAAAFCETGIALFRGDTGNPGMPEDGAMDGLSFSMTGAVRASPEADWEPLELWSYLLVERDLPLLGEIPGAGELPGAGQITVVFQPAHLFDGLSTSGDPERLALDVMANLADTATAELSATR